ncbi:nickel-dependent hydrogenase large subunit [Candidatus Methylacidiphilum infernorum]|uniref:nickel-dependent hydrogenase large subunit n=1 Tax=Candidatus Methylacidiphilum infernorum TaxID=511746 RepID=UPI002107654B|nr:nickel-dependent hydrogenase large subunit [Candidatus Methylacidiphilum infernorum]
MSGPSPRGYVESSTAVHALASVRALENALGIAIPENACFIRTIMHLTQMVHDHLVHFYHLHDLDWEISWVP